MTTLALKSTPLLKPHRNLCDTEMRALKELRQESSLVIKKADKGACIVVEDVESYVSNGLTHLHDTNTYQPLEGDPSQALSNRINQYIIELHERGFVDKDTRNFLMPLRMYGRKGFTFLKKSRRTRMVSVPLSAAVMDQQKRSQPT